MAVSHGYSKVTTSGSVFTYDTGDTINSYKGEPTTNLVNPSWSSWSVDGSGQVNIGTRTIISPYYCQIVDNNANTRQYTYIEGISASTTYTFSVQYRSITGVPTLRFQIHAYNGGSPISVMSFATTAQLGIVNNSDWQTAYITLTTPANTNRILWYMQDGDDYVTYTHAFELKNPQVEQKSHFTPFVAGTRSNTQGLLDISGYNNSISLANVSFDSNAQITFDGTDDYISLGSLGSGFSTFTVEILFKSDSVTNYRNPIDCNWLIYNGGASGFSNIGPRLEQNSSGNLTWVVGDASGNYSFVGLVTSGLSSTQFHHAVITRTASTSFSGYYNGSLTSNLTLSGWPGSMSNINIGRGFSTSSERWFIGNIPVVRVYNRALTAGEVLNNFNHYKTRFNIT